MVREVNEDGKASTPPPPNGGGHKVVGRPFPRGVSGNPQGRPRIEPRVRRYARKYDRRAVRELWRIGSDPKTPPDVARRTLMDLVAIGSGRPTLVQEVAGRDGAPLGPLVNLNFSQSGPLTPEAAYKAMLSGEIPLDPQHEAFQQRPPIDAVPAQPERARDAREAIDTEPQVGTPSPAPAAAAPVQRAEEVLPATLASTPKLDPVIEEWKRFGGAPAPELEEPDVRCMSVQEALAAMSPEERAKIGELGK